MKARDDFLCLEVTGRADGFLQSGEAELLVLRATAAWVRYGGRRDLLYGDATVLC
jgi:hypothetical protein